VQKGIDSVAVAGLTGSGTTNYVAKFTGTKALGNSQIIDNGTAIGIDMTPPTWSALEGLHIDETSFLAGHKTSEASWVGSNAYFASGAWKRIIDGSSSMIEFGSGIISMQNASSSTANSNITFTDRFRIFSNGNIGIGTTTDAGYKTDIAGTLRSTLGANFATTSGNVGIGTASPDTKLDVRGEISVAYNSTYGLRFYNDARSNWSSIGNDVTGSAQAVLVFKTGFGEVARMTHAGELLLNTSIDAGAYALQVAGSIYNTTGAVLAASSGNVGIGLVPSTTNLGRALEIINPGVQLFSYATDNIYLNANSYYSSAWKYGSTAAASQYLQFSGRHIWNQAASGTAGTNITFTTPMEINVGGELLVGSGASDAGDYKLQVNGNERIAGKLDVITTTEYGVNLGRSGTSATAFQAYNSTAAMAVGIESSTGGGLFTGTSAYAAVFGNANNYPTQFVTNNTLRATISAAGELLVGTTSDQGDYNIQTNNAIYAAGNAAGVGVLVGSDKSIETTGVNLNLNANQGGAGTSTISMKLTSATPAFTFSSDAVMLFGTNTYSTMTNGLTMKNGTAPTGSATDQFHMYSADITAGNAAAHFRTENNAVIKLYQETTGVAAAAFTANSGTAVNDASTFDGYTLKQVVKALRNLGILQ
jgi:hypothetical protein